MFELLALISTDPLDLIPDRQYPAYDNAIYRYAHPTTLFPVLKNPYILRDKDNNTLEPGYYEIHLSSDQRIFYFIQSNKVVMTVPVISCEKLEQPKEEETKNDKKAEKKKKKKEKKLTEKELKLKKVQEEAKQQARLKATIEDSHQGYFVLRYKDSTYKAVGYIF